MNYRVYIVSKGRSGDISEWFLSQIRETPHSWVVPKNEIDFYREALGEAEYIADGGSLCKARNVSLADAESRGVVCIQIDDDLKKIGIKSYQGQKVRSASLKEAADQVCQILEDSPYKLGGAATTDNPFYAGQPIGTSVFIIGSFMAAKPCPIRFDERFTLKEDYDYTLQHIQAYGGVCRANYVLPTFQHYTNKGGAVDSRSDSEEGKNIALLISKWGASVRLNPKRKNEILLKIKKSR